MVNHLLLLGYLKVKSSLSELNDNVSGQGIVEYMLVLGTISLVMVGLFATGAGSLIGDAITGLATSVSNCISQVGTCP